MIVLTSPVTAASVVEAIDAARPQGTSALVISGATDSRTSTADFGSASVWTGTYASNGVVVVSNLQDGGGQELRITLAAGKTLTLTTTGLTQVQLGGEQDPSAIVGSGGVLGIGLIRAGSVVQVTVIEET